MFLISSCSPANPSPSDSYSQNCRALAETKHHSVPSNEAIGCMMVTEAGVTYLMDQELALFSVFTPTCFSFRIGIDSECFLWSLNPNKVHKSILIKNITRNIHALCKDLTRKFPFVQVIFYHTASERNPADLCSKECPDPISAIESDLWRHGLPEMLDCNWPPASDIFLKVANASTRTRKLQISEVSWYSLWTPGQATL